MAKHKTKIMLLVIIVLCVFYFTGDFSLIDIQKTAIIVAIGIDKKENDFEITAQIAVPQASSESSQNNDALISSTGKTPYEAIDNIGITTGWQPKLSFCDLIVFGNNVSDEEIFNLIDYILASQKMQNSALVALAEGSAKELLSQATALDSISSFAIQKILLKNTHKANTVLKSSVRQFAMNHYSKSNFAYMPKISIIKGNSESGGESSSSQMASTAGGSGDTEGSKKSEENVIFNASNTVVYSHGKKACELNSDQTLIVSLTQKQVDESYLPVEINGEQILLSITKNRATDFIDFAQKPTYNLHLTLTTSISDGTNKLGLDGIYKNGLVSQEVLKTAQNEVEKITNEIYEKLTESDADLFEIKNKIYKFHYRRFSGVKNLELKNFALKIKASCKSID